MRSNSETVIDLDINEVELLTKKRENEVTEVTRHQELEGDGKITR